MDIMVAFVCVFFVDLTVLRVYQAIPLLGLHRGRRQVGSFILAGLACLESAPCLGRLSHPCLPLPITRAIPASRLPACHFCWLNLGACVEWPSQVPSHMAGLYLTWFPTQPPDPAGQSRPQTYPRPLCLLVPHYVSCSCSY